MAQRYRSPRMLDGAVEGSNHAPGVVSSRLPSGGDGLTGPVPLTLDTDASRLGRPCNRYLMTEGCGP